MVYSVNSPEIWPGHSPRIGKIVVSVPLLTDGSKGGAYALTGGTGALGLFVARRLMEEGAKVRLDLPS